MSTRKSAVAHPFACMVSSNQFGDWLFREGQVMGNRGCVSTLECRVRKGATSDSTLRTILDLRMNSEDSRQHGKVVFTERNEGPPVK